MRNVGTRAVLTTAAAVFSAAVMVTPPTIAGAQQARTIIDADTTLQVRTNDAIDVKTADGLIYKGTIDQDVLDRDGLVAIPEGSTVELMARKSGDEMTLDLESVTVNGQRYAVLADQSTVGTCLLYTSDAADERSSV